MYLMIKRKGLLRMVRMRTIDQAIAEIKEKDANTGITRHCLKQLVINGEIPFRKSGRKYLINMDDIEGYYSDSAKED